MKQVNNVIYIILMSCLFLVLFSPKAYAYIDPGSGSFIIQMVIAAICGMLFGIKIFWQRIKLFFLTLFTRDPKPDDEKK